MPGAGDGLVQASDPGPSVPTQASRQASTTPVEHSVAVSRARATPGDFVYGRTLGEGAFARVVLCRRRDSGKRYEDQALAARARDRLTDRAACLSGMARFAVKIMLQEHIRRLDKAKNVLTERRVLTKLRSRFVVNLYASFKDAEYLYLVLELADGGELLAEINRCWQRNLAAGRQDAACSVQATQFYTAEIVAALEFLMAHKIVHRDLKPENILLLSSGHVKLTDFGTALDLADEPSSAEASDFVGTADYVSPEVLNGRQASSASDLWALGCIIHQLLTGRPPFRAPSEYLTFQVIQAHCNVQRLWQHGTQEAAQGSAASLEWEQPPAPSVSNGALWLAVAKAREKVARGEIPDMCTFWRVDRLPPDDLGAGDMSEFHAVEESPPSGPFPIQDLDGQGNDEGFVCPCYRGTPLWELVTPESVPESARHLILRLLVEAPERRLGTERMDHLKGHVFLTGLLTDVDELFSSEPPSKPETMQVVEDEVMRDFHEDISDDEFAPKPDPTLSGGASSTPSYDPGHHWAAVIPNGQQILCSGLVEKRKGFVWRTRMLVLTSKPSLLYFDPDTREPKGEIPWSAESPVTLVRKSADSFDVVSPLADHRAYHFTSKEPGRSGDDWIQAIRKELAKQQQTGGRGGPPRPAT